MSYQEQLVTPQELSYRREQINSANYSDYDTDRIELQKRVDTMIDESDALAHQALSRILNLIREHINGTPES